MKLGYQLLLFSAQFGISNALAQSHFYAPTPTPNYYKRTVINDKGNCFSNECMRIVGYSDKTIEFHRTKYPIKIMRQGPRRVLVASPFDQSRNPFNMYCFVRLSYPKKPSGAHYICRF